MLTSRPFPQVHGDHLVRDIRAVRVLRVRGDLRLHPQDLRLHQDRLETLDHQDELDHKHRLHGCLAHKKLPFPQDHFRALGICLLQGPRGRRFLMSEVDHPGRLGPPRADTERGEATIQQFEKHSPESRSRSEIRTWTFNHFADDLRARGT